LYYKCKPKSAKAYESIYRALRAYGLTLGGEGEKQRRAILRWQRRLFQCCLSSYCAGQKKMQSGRVLHQTLHVNFHAQFSKATFHKNPH